MFPSHRAPSSALKPRSVPRRRARGATGLKDAAGFSSGTRLLKRFLQGALVAAAAAFPTGAMEYTRFEMLPVTPMLSAGEVADCTESALFNVPPVWMPGDVAVVMLTAWRVPDPERDRLLPALLFEHVAVLEIAAVPCRGVETPARAVPPNPLAAAFGALVALRHVASAGLVVAIGHGPEGRHALAAIEEAEAAARLGPDGPRFAAAAALSDGPPVFVLGAARREIERAPERLNALCRALGVVAPEPTPGDAEISIAACRAAMANDAQSVPRRAAAARH